MFRTLAAIVIAIMIPASAQAQTQPELKGNIYIHDPTIIEIDGRYVSFATGVEIAVDEGTPRTKSSPDGIFWKETGALPSGLPDWIEDGWPGLDPLPK